jgi:hypothetical protein
LLHDGVVENSFEGGRGPLPGCNIVERKVAKVAAKSKLLGLVANCYTKYSKYYGPLQLREATTIVNLP